MKPAFRPAAKPLALALGLAFLGMAPAHALQFELPNDIKLQVDTTVSYGISVRAASRDQSLIGIANGGTTRSVNEDNGDLNFEKNKAFQNLARALTEVEVKYKNFGFFGRGVAYYDFDLHDSDKLGSEGRKRLGEDVVGLDGFVYARFDPAGHTVRVRAGSQVISWGESTFIANGINVINPVDLSKVRIPGSELKEAFIPTSGLWTSLELTKSATVEGFYLTNFDKVRLDPRGSYFSNNDAASDDADRVIVSFGRRHDNRTPPGNPVPPGIPVLSATAAALHGPFDPAAQIWVPRSADHNPSDHGQYGVAFRYLAKEFNETEFGFYYMNYHSRTRSSGVKGAPPRCSPAALIAPICANRRCAFRATGPRHVLRIPGSTSAASASTPLRPTASRCRANTRIARTCRCGTMWRPCVLGLPNLLKGSADPGAPAAPPPQRSPDGTVIRGFDA